MVKKILTLPSPFNNQNRFSSNVVCCKNYCSDVYIMYSIICFSPIDYKCMFHWQKYAKITPKGITLATYIQSAFSKTKAFFAFFIKFIDIPPFYRPWPMFKLQTLFLIQMLLKDYLRIYYKIGQSNPSLQCFSQYTWCPC